jgi:hypothetical protein
LGFLEQVIGGSKENRVERIAVFAVDITMARHQQTQVDFCGPVMTFRYDYRLLGKPQFVKLLMISSLSAISASS